MKNFRKYLIPAMLIAVVGCHGKSKTPKLQYMPDMADSPTVKAHEDYLDPPEGSIAKDAIIYPEEMAVAESEFRNPFPANAENLEVGRRLFNIYCAVCHGADGKGQGTLTEAYPRGVVPDITRPDLASRKDGFFFMKITQGGPVMPKYGHATTRQERWQITLYLRTLQKN